MHASASSQTDYTNKITGELGLHSAARAIHLQIAGVMFQPCCPQKK